MSEKERPRRRIPTEAWKKALESFEEELREIEEKGKEERKKTLVQGVKQLEKEKDVLKSSRVVTERLSEARREAGISSAVGTAGKIKRPRMFGKKEFEALLERELLLVGNEELKQAGGLISIKKLYEHFKETRPNWKIKEKEILNALSRMENAGVIPGFITVSEKKDFVLFRPLELDNSVQQLLKAASGGITELKQIAVLLDWSEENVLELAKMLEKQGICIIEEDNIFFPGMAGMA